jgi:hypothetical protein
MVKTNMIVTSIIPAQAQEMLGSRINARSYLQATSDIKGSVDSYLAEQLRNKAWAGEAEVAAYPQLNPDIRVVLVSTIKRDEADKSWRQASATDAVIADQVFGSGRSKLACLHMLFDGRGHFVPLVRTAEVTALRARYKLAKLPEPNAFPLATYLGTELRINAASSDRTLAWPSLYRRRQNTSRPRRRSVTKSEGWTYTAITQFRLGDQGKSRF